MKMNLIDLWKVGAKEYVVLALFMGLIMVPFLLLFFGITFLATAAKSSVLALGAMILFFALFFIYLPIGFGKFFLARFEPSRNLDATFRRFFKFTSEGTGASENGTDA